MRGVLWLVVALAWLVVALLAWVVGRRGPGGGGGGGRESVPRTPDEPEGEVVPFPLRPHEPVRRAA